MSVKNVEGGSLGVETGALCLSNTLYAVHFLHLLIHIFFLQFPLQ